MSSFTSSSKRSDTTYSCTFCSFRSSNGIEFVKHLFQAHNLDTNFLYACGISSCTHVFTTGATFDTFRGHCTRKHHNWQHCFVPTTGEEEADPDISGYTSGYTEDTAESVAMHDVVSADHDCNTTEQMDTNDFSEVDSLYNDGHGETVHSECGSSDNVKIAAAKFILTLKERFKLTQASLDYTIKAVEEITLLSANALRQSILDNLELATTPFDLQSSLANPFLDLKTEYQQSFLKKILV